MKKNFCLNNEFLTFTIYRNKNEFITKALKECKLENIQ